MRIDLGEALWLPIGTVIAAYCGFYWHEGIVYGHLRTGEPLILSISREGRRCERFTGFAGSQTTVDISYPSRLPGGIVVWRAFRAARRPYHWADWNCQYLVRYAHGLKPESPTVNGYLGAALCAAIAAGIAAVAR